MRCVCFLELANDDIYVGSRNDLRRLLRMHQTGAVQSMKAYLPCAVKSYVAVLSEDNARPLERYFKPASGKAFANKRLWSVRTECCGR